MRRMRSSCGSSRIFAQPVDDVDHLYSLIIARREAVESEHRFAVIVRYRPQRTHLALKGAFRSHVGGHLPVIDNALLLCDKIDLGVSVRLTASSEFSITATFIKSRSWKRYVQRFFRMEKHSHIIEFI